MERIARETYEGRLKPGGLDTGHVLQTYRELNNATGTGYGKDWLKMDKGTGAPSPESLRMQGNIFRFSGAKNYAMLEELNRHLVKDGQLTDWNEFKKAALSLNDKYNVNHLQAEWQTARQGGRMAALWAEYEDNAGLFPNLKYRTQGDKRVRDEHRKLEGTIAPINSSFWDSYYPPNGWRCRCYVVQTAEPATKEDALPKVAPEDVSPEFRNNIGKGGQVFKEGTSNKGKPHPYFALARTDDMEKRINRFIAKTLQADAKEKLRGKSIAHKEVEGKITFNSIGIKEAINQPHEDYFDKNWLIGYMDAIIPNAEYLGFAQPRKENPMILGTHVFKIELNGRAAYILVRENALGEKVFYSISDNPKLEEMAKK